MVKPSRTAVLSGHPRRMVDHVVAVLAVVGEARPVVAGQVSAEVTTLPPSHGPRTRVAHRGIESAERTTPSLSWKEVP